MSLHVCMQTIVPTAAKCLKGLRQLAVKLHANSGPNGCKRFERSVAAGMIGSSGRQLHPHQFLVCELSVPGKIQQAMLRHVAKILAASSETQH